ncbi:hypothetical protein L9F63_002243, partial [Diploptera punctata]
SHVLFLYKHVCTTLRQQLRLLLKRVILWVECLNALDKIYSRGIIVKLPDK